ncbi:uncharacterized protein LOC121858857, partial [Homarus americanus]|uniref:uncharacterized protein LOC121858857 n=1 Tax=Homarus americanus TaxID=6706 RepID=UPI001C46035E
MADMLDDSSLIATCCQELINVRKKDCNQEMLLVGLSCIVPAAAYEQQCEVPPVSSPASHSDSGCASPSEGSEEALAEVVEEVLAPLVTLGRVSMGGAPTPAPTGSRPSLAHNPLLTHNNNTLHEVKGEPSNNATTDVFEALPPYTPAATDKHDLSASHLQQLYSSTMQAYGGNSYMQPSGFYNTMPNSQYSYGTDYLL